MIRSHCRQWHSFDGNGIKNLFRCRSSGIAYTVLRFLVTRIVKFGLYLFQSFQSLFPVGHFQGIVVLQKGQSLGNPNHYNLKLFPLALVICINYRSKCGGSLFFKDKQTLLIVAKADGYA